VPKGIDPMRERPDRKSSAQPLRPVEAFGRPAAAGPKTSSELAISSEAD
jgi:hypothetical protein